ncbi:MAG: methyltransferase domain-containing protein [Candidatus Faecousia sp.]|nr:methyltransferase domain-containing protein [Candidatus Faecousia sp.]
MNLICPICGGSLSRQEGRFVCPENHSFDIARQGYVNLLTVQRRHSAHPGDTREQVLSRREFLTGGFYAPISDALIAAAEKYGVSDPILDVGCGEGYYCTRLADAMGAELTGLDISKDAVRYAAGKYKNAQWLCATAAQIPVENGSAGLITSLFAVTLPEEFHRVLKENGFFFQVLAAQDHLLELKKVIYDQLIFREKDTVPELPGFSLAESIPIRFSFTVEGQQVQNLFAMTPHLFRVGKAGAERLRHTERLTDTASCVLNVFRRT